jgi:hypothetical protein
MLNQGGFFCLGVPFGRANAPNPPDSYRDAFSTNIPNAATV